MRRKIENIFKILFWIIITLFFIFYFYIEIQQNKDLLYNEQIVNVSDIIIGSVMYLIFIPALIKWFDIEKGPERAPSQVKREEKEYHKDTNKSFKNNKKYKNYGRRK